MKMYKAYLFLENFEQQIQGGPLQYRAQTQYKLYGVLCILGASLSLKEKNIIC